MPTSKPRYAITDTAAVAAALDDAARRWPELEDDRKALLMRLFEIGARQIRDDERASMSTSAQQRREDVTRRLDALVDVDALLADTAWR